MKIHVGDRVRVCRQYHLANYRGLGRVVRIRRVGIHGEWAVCVVRFPNRPLTSFAPDFLVRV